jgi:hypothetical protein
VSPTQAAAATACLLSAVFLTAACGGGDEASSPTDTATVTVTETTQTTTASEPAPVPTTPDPKDLVAQLSDLPTGYSVDRAGTGPRSLAEALENASPEQAAVIERERIAGYEVTFESPNLALISCTASTYRSSDGAQEVYRIGVERAPTAATESGGKLEPASLEEEIGEEAAAFTGEFQGASAFTVVWRDRNVLGLCISGGLLATDPQQTVRVAQAQQERISNALR